LKRPSKIEAEYSSTMLESLLNNPTDATFCANFEAVAVGRLVEWAMALLKKDL